jgi:hypothetical protein
MATVISTGAHPKALWPGIHAWYGRMYDEHKVEYTDLFDEESSRRHTKRTWKSRLLDWLR